MTSHLGERFSLDGRKSHVAEMDLSVPQQVAAHATKVLREHRIYSARIIRCSDSRENQRAVAALTKALPDGWTAHNAMAPGYIETKNTAVPRAEELREAEITGRTPAGRRGTPGDLAGTAVFLAGSASDYVTGHVLAVDGGWLAR